MPENPQIQQLLAALPEMFPGVQKIPLANIRLNPNNPGAKAAEEDIDELAANIALVGLKNAAKVMPDPAGPLSPGLSPHPDNFRLKADNTPWSLSDFRFLNLSGELRQLACQRLQWTVMDGIILNPTPEEAVEITDLDNAVRDKGWWAKYQSIENLIKANPNLKQREVATRLKTNVKRVNWAISLLPLLNTEARGVLVSNGNKSNKGKDAISEISASHLADLGPGSAFKPGGTSDNPPQTLYPYPVIPPETQDLVYRTLVVARDRQMKETQVQKLVESVQAGNPPETFGSAPKEPKAKKAPGITPEALAKAVELAKALGVAEGRGEDTKPAQDLLDAHLSEVKAGSTPKKPEVPSDPVLSPKGLSLLKQKIKNFHKAVFKSDTDTKNDPNVGSDQTKPSHHSPKKSKVAHWFEKFGEWVVKHIWHKFVKYEHRACKEIAKEAVPEHYTLHSGHKGSRGFLKALTVLPLTLLHWAVYGVCQFVLVWAVTMGLVSRFAPSLRPLFEWPFRFAARQVLDLPSWAWAWATAPGNFWPALATAVVVIWLGTLAYKAEPTRMQILGACLAALLYFGHRWAYQPSPWTQTTEAVSTPVPQTTPVIDVVKQIVSTSKPKEKPKPTSAPVMAYQPSVSFAPPASSLQTLYDPKLLEQEIAALPKNCIVKSFPVLTDEGMPGDLAVSRMQGVTDPDKYTMKIGSGTEKIVSINTTTTNLIINYKSTDPFSILDGTGPLNFFWEDVLYIHTDEIDVEGETPNKFYQLSLVVSGSKYALTIQCASVDDLKHLVSTMQYFIRNSRLGHDTALAGLPYPLQGLVLNNDCVVDKLWANSPMDAGSDMEPAQPNLVAPHSGSSQLGASQQVKAGVTLGDHLWSIGKVTSERQSRNDLEKGLSTLPVTFFSASPAEWEKALAICREPGQANNFRPKLKKVVIGML